jgi:hypothetical protein
MKNDGGMPSGPPLVLCFRFSIAHRTKVGEKWIGPITKFLLRPLKVRNIRQNIIIDGKVFCESLQEGGCFVSRINYQ